MHLRAITIASHCITPPEFILSSFCSVRLCQQNLAHRLAAPGFERFMSSMTSTSYLSLPGAHRGIFSNIESALTHARWVTLVGPPGVGKSAMARELLARQARGDRDVVMLDLHECHSSEALWLKLRTDLGVQVTREATESERTRRLAQAIAHRSSLCLALDNIDTVFTPVRELAVALNAIDSSVCVLVTSRQELSVEHEHVFRLEPLEWPAVTKLFEHMASRVVPHYKLVPEEEAALSTLTDTLGTLPLVLELVASWVHMLPPSAWCERLDKSFDLLKRRSSGERHESLDTAFELSWSALSQRERRILEALSVFPGSFDLSDAEAVVEGIDLFELMDGIEELRSRSLVHLTTRSTMWVYNGLRQFIWRMLDPSHHHELELRHARHFLGEAHRLGEPNTETVMRLAERIGHIRMATQTWLSHDVTCAASLAMVLDDVYAVSVPCQEHDMLLERVLSRLEDPTWISRLERARADVSIRLGELERAASHIERATHLLESDAHPEDALKLALTRARHGRMSGDAKGSARAATQAIEWARQTGDARAKLQAEIHEMLSEPGELMHDLTPLVRALDRARMLSDERTEAMVLNIMGVFSFRVGAYEQAHQYYQDALRLARRLKNHQLAGASLNNLSLLDHWHARLEDASTRTREAFELVSGQGELLEAHVILANLGSILVDLGQEEEAHRVLERAGSFLRLAGHELHLATVIRATGALAHRREALALARDRYEQALELSGSDSAALAARLALAVCLAEMDDLERARHVLEVVKSQPLVLPTWWMGLCLGVLGLWGDEESWDRATQIFSERTPPVMAQAWRVLQACHEATDFEEDMLPWYLLPHLARLESHKRTMLTQPLWRIHQDGYFFESEETGHVDMRRRGPARQLMVALARLHGRSSSEALDLDALFEIGWPEEAGIHPDAANKRVYAAIGTLRKLGLEHILITTSEGYLFDPLVEIQIVTA